jgi:D-alanine-D-alanine ligase-like ATP-grasp enzyme
LQRNEIEWPAFVKPSFRDASIGIDQRSVVTDRAQLEKQVARAAGEQGFPILVERFVHGREISVIMIDRPELRVLPSCGETHACGRQSTAWLTAK